MGKLKGTPSPARADGGTQGAVPAPSPEDRKATRKEKLTALQSLAQEQQRAFTEGQRARQIRDQAQAEVARLKAEADSAKAVLEDAKKDPWAWLQKTHGITARQLAERVAKGDDPNGALKELTEKVIAQEAELQRQREEWTQREQRSRQEVQYAAAKKSLVDKYEGGKDKYPTLHAVIDSPTELVKEFLSVVEEIKSNPELAPFAAEYSDDEVLEAMEARWKKRTARLVPAGSPAGTPAQTAMAPVRPSLSIGTASQPAILPVDFKKLSPKDQVRVMADVYRKNRKV
jgi:chromosome segregation ATPase